MKKLSQIPVNERPREKLLKNGPRALSDLELLAILLGSGTQTHDVMTMAAGLLKLIDETSANPGVEQLQGIDGVGPAKASLIAAALEFARRRIRPEGLRIAFPWDILPLIRHYADRKQEHFLCVSITGAKEVIATRVVSIGMVDKTRAHPREVFAGPIVDRAAAIIVAHNHPAGGLFPSKADMETTRRLEEAGRTLGIEFLDHIIFNHKDYYSFSESGDL